MNHYITDPPRAFIEAVVGGYSPIDKWTCHFARVAAKYRAEPGWITPPSMMATQVRGTVHCRVGTVGFVAETAHGEIPWRTLHAEPSGTTTSG